MILPLVAICLTALLGCVALAVDVGMVAVAKTQCQNAADAAAIAGSRSLDGSTAANLDLATETAIRAATANKVLSQTIDPAKITVVHGAYHYDSDNQKFRPEFPPRPPDNYNLTEVTITHEIPTLFARVFRITSSIITAKATAAHRPRDVVIVLDYSGSMNNQSDLWNNEGYLGASNNSPNNTDPIYPQFGPYAPGFSPGAALQCTSSDPQVGTSNVTRSVLGVPSLVDDFFKNNGGAAAFKAAQPSITNTNPGGDNYLPNINAPSKPAINWRETTNLASFPGYKAIVGGAFKGYTEGPGYWGKTFFIWPPDKTDDWRKLYFKSANGSKPLDDNTKLWDASGNWKDPAGNYQINYQAILAWIKANPKEFPNTLRGGHILYYDAIPDDVPASAYDHTKPNRAIADPNQRFWKEYIDFTIGVWRDPMGNIQRPGTPSCSYGPDFICGTGGAGSIRISAPQADGFIHPLDNPRRPRHRLWFGPMTMVQYLLDTGLMPGNAHDISLIAAKLGIAGALKDIQNNHPNDQVALVMFSRPNFEGEPAEASQFPVPRVSLSRDYDGMMQALWFPPGGDVRPWDANDQQTPRAHGDYCSNTATDYGLMLAYNQFSSEPGLRASGMGGYGRRGAQKMVILETDGMANVATSAATTNHGPNYSYYNVGSLGTVRPSGASGVQSAIDVARVICAPEDSAGPLPGYASPRKPVLLHCIAFGPIFEPTASGSEPASAVSFLQQLSTIGGTVFPSSADDPQNGYKWCVGSLAERQEKLRKAFTKIMDSSVSVVLVK